jgi:hypothetical protein
MWCIWLVHDNFNLYATLPTFCNTQKGLNPHIHMLASKKARELIMRCIAESYSKSIKVNYTKVSREIYKYQAPTIEGMGGPSRP